MSISLSQSLVQFVEQYKLEHDYKSRSQVIETALQLLQTQELEKAYAEAAKEVDLGWDITIADGLSDETW
ncbi:ribbon-helix-helix domain-containing protein [Leptolyngbya sp. NIES-2104]|uniref:ribbon-helix-helix domain-containing protein n=1 Tax=Leptolyngbya sp. NIES-2104 TaxID=1552121 RepID=UPI0021F20707|nr:ribbon-helix-helix domain-containing protein [Leptolyngbya sp. NIES-2104]